MTSLRVGVVGASGYVGGELLRLLVHHPGVEVTLATSRQHAGEYVYRIHPNLRKATELQFVDHKVDLMTEMCDLVFTAVPHGSSLKIIPLLEKTGMRIVDMSADFRLKDPKDFERWYGYVHPHPELLSKFVFGVPELHREELRNARLVAAPGCMAVTSMLALAPLVKSGLIELEHIIVDTKIGSSGAGGKPSIATHHAERTSVVRPYKPVGHRHTGEIEQELSRLAGKEVRVSMSCHAVDMVRGILCTNHVFTSNHLTVPEVWKCYRSLYGEEPFIRLVRDNKGLYRLPDPKVLAGSNYCDIGFEIDSHSNRLVVLSATDNLMKGAAGSGVQSMNVMCNFDERSGLESPGLHPM